MAFRVPSANFDMFSEIQFTRCGFQIDGTQCRSLKLPQWIFDERKRAVQTRKIQVKVEEIWGEASISRLFQTVQKPRKNRQIALKIVALTEETVLYKPSENQSHLNDIFCGNQPPKWSDGPRFIGYQFVYYDNKIVRDWTLHLSFHPNSGNSFELDTW